MFCVNSLIPVVTKYQGHQILATLFMQGLYIHFILVGGLLAVSDIMAKIETIWLTFGSLRPVVTLDIQSKSRI